MAYTSVYIRHARDMGREQALSALTWTELPEDHDELRKLYKSLDEDVDPEVEDKLPHPDLSGEMADGLTPERLYYYIGLPTSKIEALGQECCAAYEDSFNDMVHETIKEDILEALKTEVLIKVSVDFAMLDPEQANTLLEMAENVILRDGPNDISLIDSMVVVGEDAIYA